MTAALLFTKSENGVIFFFTIMMFGNPFIPDFPVVLLYFVLTRKIGSKNASKTYVLSVMALLFVFLFACCCGLLQTLLRTALAFPALRLGLSLKITNRNFQALPCCCFARLVHSIVRCLIEKARQEAISARVINSKRLVQSRRMSWRKGLLFFPEFICHGSADPSFTIYIP